MKKCRSKITGFIRSAGRAGLAVSLLVGLTGCIAVVPVPSSEKIHGKIITPKEVKFIVPGQTTRAEVMARLGEQFRDSPRQPVLAYSWEKPAVGVMWGFLLAGPDFEFHRGGYSERSYWRAFFVEFDSGERVRRTEFKHLSGKKSLDEQLEDWAKRHGAASTIGNNVHNTK
jgi:hypothetical protein